MKDKFKSYNFWVSLSGAVVVLVETIGRAVGFIPNGELINDIIMAVAGVLVVFGVVSMPSNSKTLTDETQTEEKTEDPDKELKNEETKEN